MTIVDGCTDISIYQFPAQLPIACIQSSLLDFPLRYLPIFEHTPNGVGIPVKAPIPSDLHSMLRHKRCAWDQVDTILEKREDNDEACEKDYGRQDREARPSKGQRLITAKLSCGWRWYRVSSPQVGEGQSIVVASCITAGLSSREIPPYGQHLLSLSMQACLWRVFEG